MTSLSSFKKLEIVKTPPTIKKSNDATKFWEKFQTPKISKEFLAINHTSISDIKPYDYLVNSTTKLSLYNGLNDEIVKTFNSGNSHLYGGDFRSDGSLIACGTNDASVVIFDVKTGHKLRELKGHQKDVRCCFFMNNQVHVISCADDSTCKLWDISMETCIVTFKGHKDYVRCGSVLKQNENIFMSGSYDHTVCMWDVRMKPEKPQRTFEHENPVECLKVNQIGKLLYCGNGNTVQLWDAFGSTTKELGSFSNHIKTVTCVDLVQNGSRIMTGSIDRTIKIHDPLTYNVLQSSQYISPLVTLAKSKDESRIVIGTSTGHLYVLNLNEKFVGVGKNLEKDKTQHLTLDQNVHYVDKTKHVKYSRFEKLLRKFEYKAAMEEIFTPGKYQEKIVISVVQEIIRQNALLNALKNCSLPTINQILKFISDVIRSSNQIPTLITLIDNILCVCENDSLLFSSLDVTEKLSFESNLARIHSVIEKELSVHSEGFQVLGMIGMINQFKSLDGASL